MNSTRNKVIAVATVAIVMLALLACGGNNKQETANNNAAKAPAATEQTAAPAASQALTGNAEKGKTLYAQTCSACHGPDATGVKGLGKDLVHSKFAKGLTDAEFLAYVKKGRSTDDPLNTTGIAMPPKGGNPALTDQDIMDIIAYLRTLEK